MKISLVDKLRSAKGRAEGYSECSNCHRTWNVVHGKSITYNQRRGMFPVCEECFDILKPDEIDKHIDNLILSWARFGDDLNEQSFESVAENAKLEMRRMKEGKGSDL